jgi:hypothetical protein
MDPMLRIFPIATALAAVLLSGTVHGLWTDRWKLSDEPGKSAAKLSQVALSLPDWEGQELPAKPAGVTGVAGQLFREYQRRHDGRAVRVFLVCGRPGPVSVHTPDVCYGAGGYEVISQAKWSGPAEAGSPEPELWTAQFRKTQASDQQCLRIFWSWNAAGPWQAPQDPRFAFARYPALYKLYVIRELSDMDEPVENDPCLDLMKQLLPELQRAFFSQS